MKKVYISNKYEIQIEPIQFEWDMFLPTLEKDFLDILNEVLSCKIVKSINGIQM